MEEKIQEKSMFASQSVLVHLLRGVGGFGAFALAIALAQFVWPILVLFPLGLFLLRGCPMCWTMGLIETITRALRKKPSSEPLCYECSIKSNINERT